MSTLGRLNDDGKLKRRFYNKRVNAEKEGIEFLLTPRQFVRLMLKAKVTSSQLGVRGFHLSRKKDEGPYSYTNCRFLWYLDNFREKWTRLGHEPRRPRRPWNEYVEERRRRAHARLVERRSKLHPSYAGKRNSGYGTIWITNGVETIRVKKGTTLPRGFRLGRTL